MYRKSEIEARQCMTHNSENYQTTDANGQSGIFACLLGFDSPTAYQASLQS